MNGPNASFSLLVLLDESPLSLGCFDTKLKFLSRKKAVISVVEKGKEEKLMKKKPRVLGRRRN